MGWKNFPGWLKGTIWGIVINIFYVILSFINPLYIPLVFFCSINNMTNQVFCGPNPIVMILIFILSIIITIHKNKKLKS
jgi:hypothetical protein